MPRIDPLQLLKCLGILLGPHGGIKSPEDVARLVSLMSKFSKKLVSKCIYVQILQATSPDLLAQFMRQGGWDLVSVWIIEAAQQGNGPLLEQLLALTIHSPLDINQLQINNCPRAVKGLTREAPTQRVRELAVMVVDSWVQMARMEVKQPQQVTVTMPPMQTYSNAIPNMMPTMLPQAAEPTSTVNQEYLQQQPEPQQFMQIQPLNPPVIAMSVPQAVEHIQVDEKMLLEETVEVGATQLYQEEIVNEVMSQNVEVHEVPNSANLIEESVVPEPEEEETNSGGSAEENDTWDAPLGQLPLYKIVIRDGKQVLAKICSGERQAKTADSGTSAVVINVTKEEAKEAPASSETPAQETGEVPLKQEVSPKRAIRGPNRRKQLLKPSVTDSEAPLEMSDTERKKVTTQEKISVRMTKELEIKRAERILREKHAKLKEKLAEREVNEKARLAKMQEEKDQATLAKLMGSNKVGTVGKIPKKLKTDDDKKSSLSDERKSELRRNSSEDERRKDRNTKIDYRKEKDDSKKGPQKVDSKKESNKSKSSATLNGTTAPSQTPTSSSTPAVGSGNKSKVKTFHAKPRSTGLEEQPPPPPARGQSKKDKDKKSPLSLGNKRSPPLAVKEQTPPDKKTKLSTEEEVIKKSSKPKQKPIHILQDSDFFMDALTAIPRPVPRKRKRRISSSKDEQSPSGKSGKDSGELESPTQSPREKKLSPTGSRPNFQFYTDTLETSKTDEQLDDSMEQRTAENRTPTPPGDGGEDESKDSSESSTKGLLVTHRSANRVKKSVKFKDGDALCTVVYFELDETERVNVTKTFGDLKILELEAEREGLQNAKKMAISDMQDEKFQWRRLIPIDAPPALVEPGKNSEEKNIQLAREKVTLQVIYFDPSMIPDWPAEPEPENHPTTDPKTMPIDDTTGNTESVKDFSNVPWPEPKLGPPPAPAFIPNSNPFTPNHMQSAAPVGGGWRTGDGQVLVPGPGEVFQPNNFIPPNTGYETGNPVAYGYGYESPGGFMEGNNFGGPPPEMNNGPIAGPNNFMFPGPPNFRQQGPGNWGPGSGPMVGPPGPMGGPPMGPAPNDMRGGPRFRSRGGNRGSWQGPPRGGGGLRGGKGWGGAGGNNNRGVCKHFRSGYCRNGDSCNFLHPGVNSPNY